MAATIGFSDFLPWGWLEWIFGNGKHPQAERVRFKGEVLDYLTKPIFFEDRIRTTVYIIVLTIEHLESAAEEQYAFDFLISSSAPPLDYHPQVKKRIPAESVTTKIKYGETERGVSIFGYTFTSLNTLKQNQDNLRDFVLGQREQDDSEPEDALLPTRRTMKTTPLSGPAAVRWYVWKNYRDQRFLFRGENHDWGITSSSLDRLQASKNIPQTQWPKFDERLLDVVRVLDLVLNARPLFPTPQQATAYSGPASLLAPNRQLAPHALVYATLQHYGLPSPFVDLTGNLETALFFCSYPTDREDATALLFVVDREKSEIDRRLARMPDIDLYRTSRHARQAAHGLCLGLGSGERDIDYKQGEDFRKLNGVVELITFPWLAEDRAAFHQQHKTCLISVSSDRLAIHVYEACEHGLDRQASDAIRVDGVFRRVRDNLLDDRLGAPSCPVADPAEETVW
jgi:hypothetical protein